MASTIVIKVKYGETLRRFNVFVTDNEMDLGMDGLREKVRNLFSFSPDAAFTLTYVDEDGDVVTLVDEEDLCDAMRQFLNPLRITVSLNSEKNGRSYPKSSGSFTPLRSPRMQQTFQNLNSSIFEMLKTLPEPLCETLSKLSLDLTSKATSSAPGLSELVDCFSKMGLSYLNQISEFQAGVESSTHDNVSRSSMGASVTEDSNGSKVDGAKSEVVPITKSEVTLLNNDGLQNSASVEPNLENTQVNFGSVTGCMKASALPSHGVDASAAQPSCSVNISVGRSGDVFSLECAPKEPATAKFCDTIGRKKMSEKSGECHSNGKDNVFRCSTKISHYDDDICGITGRKKMSEKSGECHSNGKDGGFRFATKISHYDDDKEIKKLSGCDPGPKSAGIGASSSSLDYLKRGTPDSQALNLGDGTRMKFQSNSRNTSGSRAVLSPFDECPFTGMSLANDSAVPPQFAPPVVPFKRSYNQSDSMGGIFHRGVRCNGCGVHPIAGPRFKSQVNEDYDLCSICFSEMGNVFDYIRMDKPVNYQHPLPVKGLFTHPPRMHPLRMHPPVPPPVLRGSGMKSSRTKLDSRFIQDVNVLDGTIMAPSTPFTKIWRMRNIGTVYWPHGTQLLWIGGDKLSDTLSVEVEIPSDGVPVDKELDIAVDFIAPELPGRYISYWRMASSSGQKFGQRVWVLIQVDASLKDSAHESLHGLNLNLPPTSSGVTAAEIINAEETMVEVGLPKPDHSDKAADLVEPIIEMHQNQEQELNFPINDTLLVGGIVSNPVSSLAPSSVSYPIIDLSEGGAAGAPQPLPPAQPAVPFSAPYPSINMQAYSLQPTENNDVEANLLKELEEMGFKQVDLNKEILRMNEYDLGQSVDDLCGVADWDPILVELQEMGFRDQEMNKRLLKKNNGSIKRVVMDLIAGEQA